MDEIRIERGSPTDAELAAVVAVLLSHASGETSGASEPATSRWAASARPRVPVRGPGAWRASALPR